MDRALKPNPSANVLWTGPPFGGSKEIRMLAPETLLYPLIALIVVNLVSTAAILRFLHEKGVKIDVMWIRFKIFGYVVRYRDLTTKESGSPGGPYYTWIASNVLALLCVVLMLIGAYNHV